MLLSQSWADPKLVTLRHGIPNALQTDTHKDGVKTLINTETKDTKRNKQNGILRLFNEF